MALIDRIIKVNISRVSGNIPNKQFSTILLIGNSRPDVDEVLEYTSASSVLADFTTTDPEYKAALAIFAQSPSVDKILIVQREGEEVSDTYLSAYNRAKDSKYFYAVVLLNTLPGTNDNDIINVAAQVETDKKILGVCIKNNSQDLDLLTILKSSNYTRTFAMFQKSIVQDIYSHAALFGKVLPLQPGSATWANKELASITGDNLTDVEMDSLDTKNCNYYTVLGSSYATARGIALNGSWLDELYGLDWLEDYILVSMGNLIKGQKKIPYTEAGISLVEANLNACLEQAVVNGVLSQYSVTTPNILKIPVQDKTNRELKGVSFIGTLAGAIHKVNIDGVATNTTIQGIITI